MFELLNTTELNLSKLPNIYEALPPIEKVSESPLLTKSKPVPINNRLTVPSPLKTLDTCEESIEIVDDTS